MDDKANTRPIIIKKKKVVAGGGHHGGAWKVAMTSLSLAMNRRIFGAISNEGRVAPSGVSF